MSNNKARKYTSPILEELMSEITPEEMKATEQKMLQELNKQSSIEWLEKEINRRGPKEDNPPQWLQELYEQAKAMHKDEIVKAAARGYLVGEDNISLEDAKLYGDEYYYMTFKTK